MAEIKSRTIDNLGIGANERYAKDQQLFEPKFIEESRLVPQKTEISVLTPYVSPEFEQLFSFGKRAPWAAFAPPPNYYPETKSLFSYQLIPSLGGYEKQEADEDKLKSMEDILKKPSKSLAPHSEGLDDEEKERQTLISLFQCINQLDKTLSLINSRRNQYQRG